MAVTQENVLAALQQWIDPNTQKDYVASRSVKNLRIDGGRVAFDIELGYPARTQIETIRQALVDLVRAIPGVTAVEANVENRILAHAVQKGLKPLPGRLIGDAA